MSGRLRNAELVAAAVCIYVPAIAATFAGWPWGVLLTTPAYYGGYVVGRIAQRRRSEEVA